MHPCITRTWWTATWTWTATAATTLRNTSCNSDQSPEKICFTSIINSSLICICYLINRIINFYCSFKKYCICSFSTYIIRFFSIVKNNDLSFCKCISVCLNTNFFNEPIVHLSNSIWHYSSSFYYLFILLHKDGSNLLYSHLI